VGKSRGKGKGKGKGKGTDVPIPTMKAYRWSRGMALVGGK